MGADVKHIVVSGMSRGLGLSIAREFSERGHRVSGFARSASEEIRELVARQPDRVFFVPTDASSSDDVERFVQSAVKQFGGIHGLINNAAVGQDSLLANTPAETISSLVDINLKGPLFLTRSVVRSMLAGRGSGLRIVNISSICGSRGYAGLTVYAATKGAMDAFTRSLARELASRDVRVNGLAPGFFESEMSSALAPDEIEEIKRRTPTGRLTTQEHLLPWIELLLFGETNMTGQVIAVDGGLTA